VQCVHACVCYALTCNQACSAQSNISSNIKKVSIGNSNDNQTAGVTAGTVSNARKGNGTATTATTAKHSNTNTHMGSVRVAQKSIAKCADKVSAYRFSNTLAYTVHTDTLPLSLCSH
jgi:hypothetical protein